MRRFEFWFDFSCPYAYLASTQVEALAERTGAEIDARPMLLGGVFEARKVPQKLFAAHHPSKAAHNGRDMFRWASFFGVPLQMPADHPLRTVTALRALLVVGAPFLPLAHRFFRAYWVENRNLADDEVVRAILDEAGHDGAKIVAETQRAEIKAELRVRTEEAISRGIFGAPSFFVGDELFWGQDRMDGVERALGGSPKKLESAAAISGTTDFFFDYRCPYSAIAAQRIEAAFGANVRLRPIDLELVFQALYGAGQAPPVNDAKKQYLEKDLLRQAAQHGVKLETSSGTAGNTQLALRVTLEAIRSAPQNAPRLMRALFAARWIEGRDLADSEVIGQVVARAGFDAPVLLDGAGRSEIAEALLAETQAAVDLGAFGTPTYVVHSGERRSLYFGNDRLDFAALAARGDERVA